MNLKVISTGSKGNCYFLEAENGETLIVECGINHNTIKQALDFNLEKVSGCIVTHEHSDHARSIKEIMKLGIKTFATKGTFNATGIDTSYHRACIVNSKQKTTIGNFKVMPFDIKHDAAEPVGFLINHKESGNILFLTDTMYSPYKFANLNNIILEINYSEKILDEKLKQEEVNPFLRGRIIQSHFSLENALKLLKVNDIRQVNNIVVIHLSDTNSNEKLFKETLQKHTGKTITIADDKMSINLDKTPF